MTIESKEKLSHLTPGTYQGIMSSNLVKIFYPETPLDIYHIAVEMNIGVKGMNCKCTVHGSDDGTVTAKLL